MKKFSLSRGTLAGFLCATGTWIVQCCFASLSVAQITLDGSLGSAGPLPGPDYRIDADLGQQRGSNLFHSFGDFNVHTGESATFTGPNSVNNIIGRVTGGNSSLIDGPLRSEIPDANLYLLNPSGVMFGQNATLDVKGSFHVSTADYLKLADGAEFHTDLGKGSTLSMAPPEAFGFLGNKPAGITIEGSSLQVSERKILSIVGGDIEIKGQGSVESDSPNLNAPGGRVELASVASAGEVGVNGEIPNEMSVERFGRIEVNQGAFVSVLGEGGGQVSIRGGQFVMDSSLVAARTLGSQDGEGIAIHTDRMSMSGGSIINADTVGEGKAGDIHVTTDSLLIEQGSQLVGGTQNTGQGGDIEVTAHRVAVSGSGTPVGETGVAPSQIVNWTTGPLQGNGGDIRISGESIQITEGAQILALTDNKGRAGNVAVSAKETLSISGRSDNGSFISGVYSVTRGPGDAGGVIITSQTMQMQDGRVSSTTFGDGNAGDTTVRVSRLTLDGGASISSGTGQVLLGGAVRAGKGNGGNLTITAEESISLDGRSKENFPSGFSSGSIGAGNAGDIQISTPTLTLANGAVISTVTSGDGRGGNVSIHVKDVLVSSGALLSSGNTNLIGGIFVTGNGQPGNITINATEKIAIIGAGRTGAPTGIFSDTRNAKDGGDIHIEARRVALQDAGGISARSFGSGSGGEIRIRATESFTNKGGIVTAMTRNSGHAGQIRLTTPTAEISDSGFITTATGGDGDAGTITIEADKIYVMNGGLIDSEVGLRDPLGHIIAGKGRGGNIVITATDEVLIQGMGRNGPTTGVVSDTREQGGSGGNISLKARRVALQDAGGVSARSFGDGDAGNIRIEAYDTLENHDGIVTTETAKAGGGQIELNAGSMIHLVNGDVTTSVRGGGGDAGNITIDPQFVILNDSRVVANAFEGRGGNIRINANVFLASPASVVDASSQKGIDGTVDVRSPVNEISGTFAPLPEEFLTAAELLPEQCSIQLQHGHDSSFVVIDREGIPQEPGSFMLSPLY